MSIGDTCEERHGQKNTFLPKIRELLAEVRGWEDVCYQCLIFKLLKTNKRISGFGLPGWVRSWRTMAFFGHWHGPGSRVEPVEGPEVAAVSAVPLRPP